MKKTRVPIFLYHGVSESAADAIHDPIYTLPNAVIGAQIAWLCDHDCVAIPVDNLLASPASDKKAFIITVDDCFASAYTHVSPLLIKAGFPALLFPVAGMVGRKGWVSWRELDEMRRGGMEIGSHTMTHANLTAITPDELKQELGESKKLLEDKLGVRVKHLSLPGGYHGPMITTAAIEAGYEAICGSAFGYNRYGGDRYALKRFCLKKGDGEWTVRRIMEKSVMSLAPRYVKERGRNLCRRFMGEKLYAAVRSTLIPRGAYKHLPRFPTRD